MPARRKPTRAQQYAEYTCRAFRQYVANRDVDQFHVAVDWLIQWLGQRKKDCFKPAPKRRKTRHEREQDERNQASSGAND